MLSLQCPVTTPTITLSILGLDLAIVFCPVAFVEVSLRIYWHSVRHLGYLQYSLELKKILMTITSQPWSVRQCILENVSSKHMLSLQCPVITLISLSIPRFWFRRLLSFLRNILPCRFGRGVPGSLLSFDWAFKIFGRVFWNKIFSFYLALKNFFSAVNQIREPCLLPDFFLRDTCLANDIERVCAVVSEIIRYSFD